MYIILKDIMNNEEREGDEDRQREMEAYVFSTFYMLGHNKHNFIWHIPFEICIMF